MQLFLISKVPTLNHTITFIYQNGLNRTSELRGSYLRFENQTRADSNGTFIFIYTSARVFYFTLVRSFLFPLDFEPLKCYGSGGSPQIVTLTPSDHNSLSLISVFLTCSHGRNIILLGST